MAKLINNTWDIKEALAKRKLERDLEDHLDNLNRDAYYELIRFRNDPFHPEDLGKPDSVLLRISEMVSKEPELKYLPVIAYQTFSSLLKIDPHKAYEYGKAAITSRNSGASPYDQIIGAIKYYSDKLDLPAEIYQLGVEAYQQRINDIVYPEIVDMHLIYNKMAEWYSRANDKTKAIDTQQKAVEALKSKKNFSATNLATLEARLRQYRNM